MAVTDAAEGPSAIEAHELYRFYHAGDDETFALRGVSVEIAAGEMVAVVGPSGSGKSTLLNCLAGLDEPDGGHVALFGKRLTRRPESQRARFRAESIGVLMQSGNLVEHLTVEENVRAAQALTRGPAPDARELLRAVGIEDRSWAWPAMLSGGEAARAGLAVALANDPAVLLADEPTGEVDEANERGILSLLRQRASGGKAVVVVTHSPRVAEAADRTIRMLDGRIVDA
ncbi:MAG TPA: ABC transporter ATP-binding protein [Coriobacteriia bacterium]